MSVSFCACLCMSVREHISGTTGPNFVKVFVHLTYRRGSIFLWRRCDALYVSSFIDDVVFAHNGPYGSMSIPLQ